MPVKVDAVILVRLGSSRLPGKALLPLAGQPMLARQIERVRRCRLIDRVIVATTEHPRDDAIAELAASQETECFRGSEEDVLGRLSAALQAHEVEVVVELQGDNLLPDATLIDAMVGYFLKHRDQWDYVTNALKTTYPPGSEAAVYAAETLHRAEAAWEPSRPREHVGIHIYQRPDLFRVCNLTAPPELDQPDLHFEVDTEEDYQVVCRLYEHFLPHNPHFSLAQAVDYARESGICQLNQDVARRWREYRDD